MDSGVVEKSGKALRSLHDGWRALHHLPFPFYATFSSLPTRTYAPQDALVFLFTAESSYLKYFPAVSISAE